MSELVDCASALLKPEQKKGEGEKEIFEMQLVDRQRLTDPEAVHEIYHICLQPCASKMARYRPGDCLAIYPQNQKKDVTQIIEILIDANKEELISEGRSGQRAPLGQYLLKGANLTMCSASLAIALAQALTPRNSADDFFKKLCLDPSQRSALLQFCRARTVAQLLTSFPPLLTAQQLCNHLQILLPRLYSIASAFDPSSDRVDLTVSYVQIEGKWPRQGVCSHWLCRDLEIGQSLSAHLHPHSDFHPPDNSEQSILMIGAGTGIAPFRGFLQQRAQDKKKGRNWLLMGQRNRQKDFIYEDFWRALEQKAILRLDLAFSRDQMGKYYVNHIMQRFSKEIFDEIKDRAIIYVCGSIALGKSVHQALLTIVRDKLNFDDLKAERFLRSLRKEGLYKRDVY